MELIALWTLLLIASPPDNQRDAQQDFDTIDLQEQVVILKQQSKRRPE